MRLTDDRAARLHAPIVQGVLPIKAGQIISGEIITGMMLAAIATPEVMAPPGSPARE